MTTHTTAETTQTFRCAGCAAKDAEIARLTQDIEYYEAMKEGVEIRIGDMQKEIDRLTAATLRLACAAAVFSGFNKAMGRKGYSELDSALTDPVIVSLRRK